MHKKKSPTVCCISIKLSWSIKKQLLVSNLILASIILSVVIAVVYIDI